MKGFWRGGFVVAAGVGTTVVIVLSRRAAPTPPRESPSVAEIPGAGISTQEVLAPWGPTNLPSRSQGTYRLGRGHLSEAEQAQLQATFEKKLKPAMEQWCKAYAGHVPFRPEALTTENFSGAVGRGPRCMYVFVLDGMTVGIEDVDGVARLSHLNTPASKKLMQLPRGTLPDPSVPVTREQIAAMLKADSGTDFTPAEIRVTPTAFSSAMSGGAQVSVGGEPVNSASWKFTLVFGADGNLTYYMRGR